MELPYLKQDCLLTLREGLTIYYSIDPSYKGNTKLAPAFYNHDIVHVLFGLDTSLVNESLTDTRCIFATNWGLKKYISDYLKDPEAKKIIKVIFKDIGYFKVILFSIMSIPKVIRTFFDCMRMNKKWEINPSDKLLDTKLYVLRKKYNITIIN